MRPLYKANQEIDAWLQLVGTLIVFGVGLLVVALVVALAVPAFVCLVVYHAVQSARTEHGSHHGPSA